MEGDAARAYVAAWTLALLGAVALVAHEPHRYALFDRRYWRMIAAPWKLAAFALAALPFVAVAPYSGDPTWDHVDAAFMSALTFATAPFSVGVLYRAARGRLPRRQAYVAACVWMFSSSWSYDAWVFWRDGAYPPSWSSNILASSVLYASAGLFWSLAYMPGRGLTFAFLEDPWPEPPPPGGTIRILAFGALFVLLVVGMMSPFALDAFRTLSGRG